MEVGATGILLVLSALVCTVLIGTLLLSATSEATAEAAQVTGGVIEAGGRDGQPHSHGAPAAALQKPASVAGHVIVLGAAQAAEAAIADMRLRASSKRVAYRSVRTWGEAFAVMKTVDQQRCLLLTLWASTGTRTFVANHWDQVLQRFALPQKQATVYVLQEEEQDIVDTTAMYGRAGVLRDLLAACAPSDLSVAQCAALGAFVTPVARGLPAASSTVSPAAPLVTAGKMHEAFEPTPSMTLRLADVLSTPASLRALIGHAVAMRHARAPAIASVMARLLALDPHLMSSQQSPWLSSLVRSLDPLSALPATTAFDYT